MSSKRRLRRNGCAGKTRHRTLRDALAAMASLRKRGGRDAQNLNAYLCPIREQDQPRHYHVGHRESADRARIP